ncbi:MAG TPA: EamA family transporter [Candidatus Saccharimonadales bacterium]|nr:EamA family transporter [Candidatus Saccharimonadales bacterium]
MGLLYVLIAIVAESTAKTVDKLNFRKNKIGALTMMLLVFLFMSIWISLFIIVTGQPIPHFELISIGLVSLVVILSLTSNIFDVLSLKANDLSLREPLIDFTPIAAGLVGYLLFPAEREPGFLLAFILGAVIVYYGSHRRKLRKFQKKGLVYLLVVVAMESMLPSVYKEAVNYLPPAYIAWFRILSIFTLALVFFPLKSVRKITPSKLRYTALSGAIYVVGTLASIYAIKELGVVLTMLLLLLGPLLRYSAGYFILKENVRKGEMISSFLLAVVVMFPVLR